MIQLDNEGLTGHHLDGTRNREHLLIAIEKEKLMVSAFDNGHSLQSLFSALTEHAFQVELGVADPPLTDYLAELLCRFVRMDAVFRVRDTVGRRLEEVAEMMMEAEQRVGKPQRELHRHIGDFTLFWSGLYPEFLSRLKSPDRKDHLVDYCEQGKRSYRIASMYGDQAEDEMGRVFRRLSDEFEICTMGLRCVRRELSRLPSQNRPSHWEADCN